MLRDRRLVFGFAIVAVSVAIKAFLVTAYIGGLADRGPSMLALVLVGVWLMTASLAGLVFAAVSGSITVKRRTKIISPIPTDPGKENMIKVHAREWRLTKAETDVAIMVVKGFSNAEIARMRGSALQTVKSQLSAIYHKSGLGGRYQLMAFITDEVCESSRAACGQQQPAAAPSKISDQPRPRPRLVVNREVDSRQFAAPMVRSK